MTSSRMRKSRMTTPCLSACAIRWWPIRPTTMRASIMSSCCCSWGTAGGCPNGLCAGKDKVLAVRRYDSLQRWIQAIEAERHQPADFAALDAAISANKRDFGSRYARAQALMAQERFTEAMDELLEILMRDKTWDEDRAQDLHRHSRHHGVATRGRGRRPDSGRRYTVASYRRRLSSVVLS